uniref:Protein Ycf2 n=1 Tax=Athrotaxis laxifolia TaxID=28976 RepID=A0A8F8STH5_ATHLA|nr:hypothetical protein RF2 [Athrotaxis laxifolia]
MNKHRKPWYMYRIEKNQKRVWFFSLQLNFKENMMEIFVPWNESNLARFLSQIFSGRESVVKLFDFRILSTLLIRDIRIFILKGQARKAVMIIAFPLFLYFFSSRAFIERNKYNWMDILPSVQPRKDNLLLVPHLFMFLPKSKRRYQRRFLNPKKHLLMLSSSNKNLNQKNDIILDNQGTISSESPSEKESNDIEWEIDLIFHSMQNEYWEPEKEPENLYEWEESLLNKSRILDGLEKKIEQLEKNLAEIKELVSSAKSETEESSAKSETEELDYSAKSETEESSAKSETEESSSKSETEESSAKSETEELDSSSKSETEELDSSSKSETEELDSSSKSETEELDSSSKSETEELDSSSKSETEELDSSSKAEYLYLISEMKEIIKEIKKYKEKLQKLKKIKEKEKKRFEEMLQTKILQEEIEQKELDRTREYYSFSESEFLKGLFDDLSIDESYISYTKKPSEKLKLLRKRKDVFKYFKGLEKNRIVDLWKVKTFLKNPSVNYDILSDPGWNIRKERNKLNCIRFMNQNLSSRSPSSCDQNKEELPLNKEELPLNYYFQLKILFIKITNKFTLSITDPERDSDVAEDYLMNHLVEVNKNILLNEILNYRDKYKNNFYAFSSFRRSFRIRILPYIDKEKYRNDITETISEILKIIDNEKLAGIKTTVFQILNILDKENLINILDKENLIKIIDKDGCKLKYIKDLFNLIDKDNGYRLKYTPDVSVILHQYNVYYDDLFEKAVKKVLENALSSKFINYFSKEVDKYYGIVNDKYADYQIKLEYLLRLEAQAAMKYTSKLKSEFFKSDSVLDDLESETPLDKYAKWKKEFERLYIRHITIFQFYYYKYSYKLIKTLCDFYLRFYIHFQMLKNVNFELLLKFFELEKVAGRIILIRRLSGDLKPIQTNWIKLNNITQDAITHHSLDWIIYQAGWSYVTMIRLFKNKDNLKVLSIQIEYFQKRLEYLLSISKQNNLKNRVFNPIELWTTQHCSWYCGWFGNRNMIIDNKIYKIISDEININPIENEIKSKSIPNLESSIDEETIAPLGLNEKPIIESIIDVFDNGKNYMELLNNAGLSAIFNDRDNWLNPLKLSNQNSLRAAFSKANTFKFLDYLHHPRLNYKKRLACYMERIHLKNKHVTYGQLLNLVPIYNNLFSLSIGEIRAVYSEKETISLIKSQVNILLDKYLRDQALIHDSHQSSNLLHKLNLLIHSNTDILSIEDIYNTPLISPQIVNFDKNSCYPFLSSSDSEEKTSNQYSKNSFSSNIDLIQTQSYQDDLLSEISLRMNKFAEKEEYSSTESLKGIMEDKPIGDLLNKEEYSSTESLKGIMEDKPIGDLLNKEELKFFSLILKGIMEDKPIGDLLNKEELKFFFSELKFFCFKTLQINILFEKWGLFKTYRSWLWFLTSTGCKYTKNMFLATFPEIPINSSDQLVSIPNNIRQNWNQNLNNLWALYHQFCTLFCTLLKWEFRDKILPKLNFLLSRWDFSYFIEFINKILIKGKDRSISFDTWKYERNVRDYDIFVFIFIVLLFYISCITPLQLFHFCMDLHFVSILRHDPDCFKRVGEMIHSFRMLRKFSNLNWHGYLLTLMDYIELDSDSDDIGLSLLLKIWYVRNIKWRLIYFNKSSIGLHSSSIFHSIVKTMLYEFEVDEFFFKENKLFLLQEQISQFESKLTPPIGLFHEYFERRKQPGLLYFRYLAEFIQLGLTHRIGVIHSELNSLFLAEIPIFAAFYQKMTSMSMHSSLYDKVRFYSIYPVPSFSNRILLIGPKETGRSYLAKSLAADSYLPLIRISPKSFLRQRRLLSSYEPEFTSSAQKSYLEHENILRYLGWSGRPKEANEKDHYDIKPHNNTLRDRVEGPNPPEYFPRRVVQFLFALKLAKLMSPCVIWIPSIHELNDYCYLIILLMELLGDPYNSIEGEKETTIKQNIVVIASTHIPKKIDPLLITPPRSKRRFDTFINTKTLPAPHREKEFPLLLRNKGLYLKKEWNCYDEFGLTTKGFTTQDLAKLADNILLISMNQQNTSAIDNDIIGVALYRSSWGPRNSNKFSEFFKGLPYKIGKAIIQNKLTFIKNFLRLTLDFQGRRANYLHQWYLEPSIAGTAAKEFTIFYHILGCLAGSVAQDCWFLSESNTENWWSPFDPFIGNDFILASSLLQGLLEEFPSLAIYRGNSDYITIAPQFKRDTMQKGLSSILDQIVLSKELRNSYGEEDETPVVCDSRTWRFSFIRSNRFEHVKDITIENPLLDYLHLFGRFQERPTHLSSFFWKKFLMSTGFQPLYAVKNDDVKERKTAAVWEAKLLYNKFQRMGNYQFDTEEYATEYKPLNTPVIYLACRFLWDPVSIRFLNKNPVFEQRELFIPKELVKTIYITYKSTREFRFSMKKTLKAIRKKKKVRKIALEMKIPTYDDELPVNINIEKKESFETFKRLQEIGMRVRRVVPYSQSVAPPIRECWFREKTRDDTFKERLLKGERENIDLLSNESFIYKTLSESYEYLSNLFFSNRIFFKQMIDTLLKTKWLSPNAIDCLLAEGFNKNKKS